MPNSPGHAMTALQAWSITVLLAVGAVVVFYMLGWNVAGAIGSGVHVVEHLLGRPLALPS